MASKAQSSTKTFSTPGHGVVKVYLLLCDEIKLNYAIYSAQDQSIQHMKIVDPGKISNFRQNEWRKIRGYRIENGSVVVDNRTSVSGFNALKPEITEEQLSEARQVLRSHQFTSIATAKSDSTANYSRISVAGKIVCSGKKETKTRHSDNTKFTMQNYRIADESSTIRLVAFDFQQELCRNQIYVIHNCKKHVFQGRHQIEIDEHSVVEEAKDLSLSNVSMDMSDNEDDQELQGEVSGIVCGSVNLYDACLKCKKKLQNDFCPNRCIADSKKAVTAKIEIEYQDDDEGQSDVQLQVFSEDLNKMIGKDCSQISDSGAYEEEFMLICPIKIKFTMDADPEGKLRMTSCHVLKRWAPSDVHE